MQFEEFHTYLFEPNMVIYIYILYIYTTLPITTATLCFGFAIVIFMQGCWISGMTKALHSEQAIILTLSTATLIVYCSLVLV